MNSNANPVTDVNHSSVLKEKSNLVNIESILKSENELPANIGLYEIAEEIDFFIEPKKKERRIRICGKIKSIFK